MQSYHLKENTDDGSFDLVETRPVVVATFHSQELDDRILKFLTASPQEAPPMIIETNLQDRSATDAQITDLVRNSVSRAINASAAAFDSGVYPAPTHVAPATPSLPTPRDWGDAFQAVANGESMDEVAKTLNVKFTELRARYANWKRGQKSTKAVADKEECRLCGKQFTASKSADGLCARCRHD
ncbi:hypothetical protein D2T29_15960 [Sinirhodobacter populi]|uniref:Uncharacterized protein n=1 Tax=Paenirhodobacter populi TaxID=2306993 RepID=A0A443K7K7_9RHOB|nr:hypothetical protein [Sinirhodobacter populi]RWR28725.1 hypothetical protein D2T29_15960 [Sinirhodobacter populi]